MVCQHERSLELRVIPVTIIKAEDLHDGLLTGRDEPPSVGEKLQTVDGGEMARDGSQFILVHDVTEDDIEACVTGRHG